MTDVKMTAAAAAPIIEHFRDLAAEFDNTKLQPWTHGINIDGACGEFHTHIEDATDGYHVAWRVTMETCGETAALIAGNTNVFDIELTRLDEDLTHLPTI